MDMRNNLFPKWCLNVEMSKKDQKGLIAAAEKGALIGLVWDLSSTASQTSSLSLGLLTKLSPTSPVNNIYSPTMVETYTGHTQPYILHLGNLFQGVENLLEDRSFGNCFGLEIKFLS